MKKQDLLKLIESVPNGTLIYVTSDHGQCPEQMGSVLATTDTTLEFYGEDVNWEPIEDVILENVTAILFS